MATITQTMTADISDLERKLAKLQADHLKLQERVRDTGRESKKQASEVSAVMREQGSQLMGTITSYASLTTAVNFVAQAYQAWIQRIEEAHRKSDELATAAVRGLAGAGMLARSGEVEDWIKATAVEQRLTREQVQTSLFGVAGGGPSLSLERQQAIAAEIARTAPLSGGDTAAIQKSAALAGRLGAIYGDKSAGDVADLAQYLQEAAGDRAGELTSPGFGMAVRQLQRSGAVSAEQAMALGLVASRPDVGLGPDVLAKLAQLVSDPIEKEVAQRGQSLTADQMAKNRFADASSAQRYRMLLTDRDVARQMLGGEAAAKLGLISAADVESQAAALREAQTGDLAQRRVAELATSEAGARMARKQETAAQKDVYAQTSERLGRERAEMYEWLDLRLAELESKGEINWLQSGYQRTKIQTTEGMTQLNEWAGYGKYNSEELLRYAGVTESEIENYKSWKAGREQPNDPQMTEQTQILAEIRDSLRTGGASGVAAAGRANGRE